MVDSSPVLKIRKAEGSIRERFRSYNHMRHVTRETRTLVDLLDELPQPTNVRLMHFLSQQVHRTRIMVDCHFPQEGQSPHDLEKDLLQAYFNQHHELPPLNFGFRGVEMVSEGGTCGCREWGGSLDT